MAKLREALPVPLEPTDPAVRSVFDNRQIPVEDRRASLTNERGEIAHALRDLPIRSQVFTPLSREGKANGVMIVSRSEVRPFQEHELELMRGFADQAVIAIENARLLSELRGSYRMVQQQAGKLEAQSQELVSKAMAFLSMWLMPLLKPERLGVVLSACGHPVHGVRHTSTRIRQSR